MAQLRKHSALQDRIDHKFKDHKLLDRALRHASRGGADNERLEFLGDRVLGLVIAEALYRAYPDASEGELAPRFNMLVRKEACADIADHLSLGNEMAMGRSELMSGGRRKVALLGDAAEAVIGAIYLDAGFDAAQKFILREWHDKIHDPHIEPIDAKTKLQEFLQAHGEAHPRYTVVKREGADHAPEFTVRVQGMGAEATGIGASKRKAEQAAAAALLAQIDEANS